MRQRPFVFALVVLFVLFRSAMFVFKPGLDFDSDQAIFGLMGKHFMEGRAFPLFIYGQNYLLAVEAWLAAPMFFLFGVSVATLKLPMLLMNIALGLLLVYLLQRDLKLTPAIALLASLPFVLAAPEASTTMLKTLGGTVEPLLYVVLLWLTRRRPVWFGLIAGIGILQREFTAYGVVAMLIVDAAEGAWRRKDDWVRWVRVGRTMAEVWLVVQFLKPFASASGPGTTAADLLAGTEQNNFANALHRLCFDPRLSFMGLGGLVTMHWPRLFGIEVRPLGAFGLIGNSVQGIRGAAWFFGPAVLFLLARTFLGAWRYGQHWRQYEFAVYLILVGAFSAGMLAMGRCGAVETLRYDLLSILGAVGWAGLFFAVEPSRLIRRAGVAVMVLWAAVSVIGHARIWAEYESPHPPVADKMLIIPNLEVRGIKYATADYWLAYYITFVANERIIVAAGDFPRVLEYGDKVAQHRAESVRISRSECGGGTLVFEGVYFCPELMAHTDDPINVLDFEALARARMEPSAYDYYAGAADAEHTLAENRRGFDRVMLRPRVLVDVTAIDLGSTILGERLSFPVMLAPTAFNRLGHPEGEVAAVRAAGSAGTIMVVSTIASSTLEEVADAATGPLWFQLYVYRDRDVTRDLIARAEARKYRALVLTVDTPRLGRRERDARNGFMLPPDVRIRNLEVAGRPDASHWPAGSSFSEYVHTLLDPSLTWDAIGWLRSLTSLPILVKGVLTSEDAAQAMAAGVSGIIVSNHGGRQLDGALATIDALPEIAERVAGQVPVLLDGGIRRGTDVIKALALGARAVLIGRPYLWGLAAAGEAGVAQVLAMLRAELERAMALAGCPALASITRAFVDTRRR